MELEEAKERLLFMKSQLDEIAKRNAEIDDSGIDDETASAIETVLQELDRLQKENEELKKRFRRYGDADLVKIAQIKEIEENVPKLYMDKEAYENLLKEE